MILTIGINANHADSSAVLFKDNELLYGVEEERLNRIKHWAGFPENSIKECIKLIDKNNIEEIDIAINSNILSNFKDKIFFTLKNYIFGNKKFEIYKRLTNKLSLKKTLEEKFSGYKFKINYIDHHLSHIASSYYPSGYNKAYALSIDGFGDFCSIALAKCDNGKIDIIDKLLYPNSLGVFYEAFTQLLGFNNYGDEYKVMGLSSYGKPKYFEKINSEIFLDGIYPNLNLKYFDHHRKNFKYNFEGSPKQSTILNSEINNIFKVEDINIEKNFEYVSDIAASIQKVFENKLNIILKNKIDKKFSENLVLSGGCALNSLSNGKIMESENFKNIFVPYSPGDSGGAIGASLYYLSNKHYFKKFVNIKSPYIGNKYPIDEIKKNLNKLDTSNFEIMEFNDNDKLFEIVTKSLVESKIIGWFNGPMEYGPRSLGNRAILANPTNSQMKEIINRKIKRRENFRPFAPVIIQEEKSKWFKSGNKNPYMSFVETILPEKRSIIPAVTHVDGTGRVQTVNFDENPKLYKLIYKFFEFTKVPILLNTSFNENEPIVENPAQAMNCFIRTEMDALVLENILLIKNDN
tara:strand:+ start:1958 stop:3688 length:1731 start_codon:yes stop_codon:yes gene_type:complete